MKIIFDNPGERENFVRKMGSDDNNFCPGAFGFKDFKQGVTYCGDEMDCKQCWGDALKESEE